MHRIALAALAALYTSTAYPAVAQVPRPCHPEASSLATHLGAQYGEAMTAAGVDARGNLMQVYANIETGTWTIVVTLAAGPTCIVASGEGFALSAPAVVKPGQPS